MLAFPVFYDYYLLYIGIKAVIKTSSVIDN